jgi:hypothetical protein
VNDVVVRAGMDLPSLPSEHRLHPLLQTRLRPIAVDVRAYAPHAHWPVEFFGLQRVSAFQKATREQKTRALDLCGLGLLEEAYFIEKSGVGFAAEMILLAESIEERMLYGVFAGEEARHFDAIRPFLRGEAPRSPDNPFLALLSETIECADRTALQFVIQVVLEGWGLSHYRAMRDACMNPALYARLDAILHDEAGHHGSGRVLFAEARLSERTAGVIEDVLAAMLAMVRVGPAGVVSALERALGHLSRAEKITALEELGAQAHAQARLDHLRQLVRFDSVRAIADRLEAKGLFSPRPPQEHS